MSTATKLTFGQWLAKAQKDQRVGARCLLRGDNGLVEAILVRRPSVAGWLWDVLFKFREESRGSFGAPTSIAGS